MIKLKPCPFCGGEVVTRLSCVTPMLFFCCTKCKAVISFDNSTCNKDFDKAIDYFNRRAKNDVR